MDFFYLKRVFKRLGLFLFLTDFQISCCIRFSGLIPKYFWSPIILIIALYFIKTYKLFIQKICTLDLSKYIYRLERKSFALFVSH